MIDNSVEVSYFTDSVSRSNTETEYRTIIPFLVSTGGGSHHIVMVVESRAEPFTLRGDEAGATCNEQKCFIWIYQQPNTCKITIMASLVECGLAHMKDTGSLIVTHTVWLL